MTGYFMIEYLRKHWEGRCSLAWAYWVNGVLVQVAYQGLLLALLQTTTLLHNVTLGWGAYALQLAISAWAVVGIWRSAGNSIDRARKEMRYPLWAYAARAAVVLGVLTVVADLAGTST